jgi:hypothetical protein
MKQKGRTLLHGQTGLTILRLELKIEGAIGVGQVLSRCWK